MIVYQAEWWEFTDEASHDRELLLIADDIHQILDMGEHHAPVHHLRFLWENDE